MSDEKANVDVNVEGAGCLFFFGAIIVAACIGTIYEAVYGWLAFGTVLIIWAIAAASGRTR